MSAPVIDFAVESKDELGYRLMIPGAKEPIIDRQRVVFLSVVRTQIRTAGLQISMS
jgi:hypothetical protein